jgi:hypothetical protein
MKGSIGLPSSPYPRLRDGGERTLKRKENCRISVKRAQMRLVLRPPLVVDLSLDPSDTMLEAVERSIHFLRAHKRAVNPLVHFVSPSISLQQRQNNALVILPSIILGRLIVVPIMVYPHAFGARIRLAYVVKLFNASGITQNRPMIII